MDVFRKLGGTGALWHNFIGTWQNVLHSGDRGSAQGRAGAVSGEV